MDEKYIFEGPALQKVIKENRIRIARGELIVTPLVDAAPEVEDTKVPEVEDTKVVAHADEKKPKNGKK